MLDGIRVLDLTRMLAGPYAAMILADLGAEVIKVEEPQGGDEIRRMGPPFVNGESAYFLAINRNKKSLALDLKQARGRELFYRLAGKSDVVLDNFRPGVMARLGLGYEALAARNPRLIACSVSSFGDDGPMRDLPAFDLIIQAYSGAMSLTGEPGQVPARIGIPLGDLAGGVYSAIGILGALVERGRTGRGRRIEISLLDSLTAMLTYIAQYYLADGKVPGPQGSRHMSVVPYGAYRTLDCWIVVGVFTERFWEGFTRALARADLTGDPRYATNELRVANRATLEPILEEIFLRGTSEEWLGRLRAEGVPAAPVNTIDRVLSMEQIVSRGMLARFEHPIAGSVPTLTDPILRGAVRPAPLLGQHSGEVLSGVLDLAAADVAELRQSGIIR